MWPRPEASSNPSVGGEPLVPAGQPGAGTGLWKGAPEAVKGGYERRFRYPNTSPMGTQSGAPGGFATLTLRAG